MRCTLFILLSVLFACSKHEGQQALPPELYINSKDTTLHNVNAYWTVKEKTFNGYIIETDSGVVVSKLPVLNGKENGMAYGWYRSGKRKFERHYVNGNREGVQTGWYENGKCSFVFYFEDDKYEGEQLSFYKSGNKWQSLHYAKGYEDGKQKTWSDSGRVVNNFTVKDGKLYGVVGRYDCMSVMEK